MSKRLEDFIKQNRAEFDDLEAGNDLWDKIEQKLSPKEVIPKRETKMFTLAFVLKVAAIIVVVMGAGFAFYLRSQQNAAVNLAAINPEEAKQQVQYASLVQNKRNELKVLAKSAPELYKEFSGEIAKMDST